MQNRRNNIRNTVNSIRVTDGLTQTVFVCAVLIVAVFEANVNNDE